MSMPCIGLPTEAITTLPITVSTNCVRYNGDMHFHDYTQVCHVLSGTQKHIIGGEEIIQKPGSGSIIPAYVSHETDTTESDDTPVIVWIKFYDNFMMEHGYNLFTGSAAHARFEGRAIPPFREFNEEEALVTNEIIRDLRSEFSLQRKMSYARIAELLARYFRIYCNDPIDSDLSLAKERTDAITRTAKYISTHLNEKITIEKLASIAAMSRRLFTTNFKLITGMTVHDFITSVRMQQTQVLLRFSEKSLQEIASEVGMYDKSHLSNAVTEYFGVHPSVIRESARNDALLIEQHLAAMRRWKWVYDEAELKSDTDIKK
ncbi:MAG: helix-turn-helix transcriptional regulator [Oscillospiraceae bacterium]|nr:helix-turn-helix transcriptional regulator [Oscillospiraceae bacterium]